MICIGQTDEQAQPAQLHPMAPAIERQLLGSLMVAPELSADVFRLIRLEDFIDQDHQLLYFHMLVLQQAGKPTDRQRLVELMQQLNTLGLLGEQLEGIETAARPECAHNDANMLRNLTDLRRLIVLLRNAADQAVVAALPMAEIVVRLTSDLAELSTESTK